MDMEASGESGWLLWLRLARQPRVVKRACKFSIVVGAVLIMINHGDAILSGDVTRVAIFKMALTVVVPYLVSTASSVGAQLEGPRKP